MSTVKKRVEQALCAFTERIIAWRWAVIALIGGLVCLAVGIVKDLRAGKIGE